jgi:hypothetical protein
MNPAAAADGSFQDVNLHAAKRRWLNGGKRLTAVQKKQIGLE